jgi:FtsH-binding integral membrane protein
MMDLSARFRADFVRKVYSLLSIQMGITVFTMVLCMYLTDLRDAIVANASAWMWTSFGLMFASLIALLFARNKHPWNYGFFFAFTLCMSCYISTVGAFYSAAGQVCVSCLLSKFL